MTLYEQVKKYTQFTVDGKAVSIPYCIVEKKSSQSGNHYGITTKYKHFAGKGSAEQIRQALEMTAAEKKFSLKEASPAEIKQFMINQGIGVDCSGFAYTVLDDYFQLKWRKSLGRFVRRYPGLLGFIENKLLQKNRIRRSSADTLTNSLNTYPIVKVSQMQEGDLIRLTPLDWKGKHVLVVVRVTAEYVFYAHSSANTVVDGPHVSAIKIINADNGLDEQEWLEKTKDGKNYGKKTLVLNNGDGARRFKFLK